MNNSGDTVNFTAMILVIAGFGVLLFVYMFIYKRLKVYAQKTANQWDDSMFRLPDLSHVNLSLICKSA